MLSSGLPMYGQAVNVNLSSTSASTPANITLTRACSKLRVTMENAVAGTGNAFIVENAAPDTSYAPGSSLTFSTSDLITYQQVILDSVSPGVYQGVTYVYESIQSPRLRILTSINEDSREYIASSNFPLPMRGYLYDIHVFVSGVVFLYW
ncbi:FimB/Mfa2 family fimbrial subunit [Dysgonomonas sp. GY617]|uniref:FimB/Mfa2 family fimbrial subunit n=1 Tax=Dysgonomonas sp. GY617 TaxID=2780420 RepID=UPI001F54C7C0|nr:FimB/Mfa2 family fimbrial subunit [Dysgonomonas sp. GY617]